MEQSSEKPIILAVVTLFLSVVLVYLAFFRLQWDNKNPEANVKSGSKVNEWTLTTIALDWSWWNKTISVTWSDSSTDRVDLAPIENNANTTDKIQQQDNIEPILDKTTFSNTPPVSQYDDIKNKIKKIVWLTPYYNSLTVADTLVLSIKTAFTDTGWVQYVYLGTGVIDKNIRPIIKRLWWNTIAIENENDIKKNMLRWDRVTFINIPWNNYNKILK